MIEINLLPEDLRQAEGTPLPRLVAIMGSVVVACGLGVLCSFYYMVYIPRIKQEIQQREADIASKTKLKDAVLAIDDQISKLNEKVSALDNLTQSRMRYGRVLDKLANTTPDGVWFKSFNVGPDSTSSSTGSISNGGKRYMIKLAGTATGSTQQEMRKKLTDLVRNTEREFGIPKDAWKGALGEQQPVTYGFSRELGATFNHPEIKDITYVASLPRLADVKPEVYKQLNIPTDGIDFNLEMTFQMPAPKQ